MVSAKVLPRRNLTPEVRVNRRLEEALSSDLKFDPLRQAKY